MFRVLLSRLKSGIRSLWAEWKKIVDWVGGNRRYLIAILLLMNLFGMIAPDTATALRDALLGFIL